MAAGGLLLLGALTGCAARGPVESLPAEVPAPPAREAPADDTLIYFVMVDRFANGDPDNDADADPTDPQAFHGGDLRGLIQHLDHIESMGASTLWISPVFDMRTEKFFEWGAFHGYWVRDPGAVEPRFGTEEDLLELAGELHRRDMRLLMDVVWNHVSFDSPLLETHPHWFHQRGPITDWQDPFQLVNHEVHGLPDLAQEEEEVYQWILEHALAWIRRVEPDGFRVDAVRHMPMDFLARISEDIKKEAGAGFLLLGEDFQGDPVGLAESFRDGGFDAMFDFPLHYAMLDVLCDGRHPGRLASVLSVDRLYERPDRLVTFLDNHDLPRVLTRCGEDVVSVRRALALMFSVRGIPALTWGTEAGLEGGEEPHNRKDMVFDAGHPLEDDVRRLAAFRDRHPVLAAGSTEVLELGEDRLLLGRRHGGQAGLVALNTGSTAWTLEPPDGLRRHGGEALLANGGLTVAHLTPGLEGLLVPPESIWVGVFRDDIDGPEGSQEEFTVTLGVTGVDLAEGESVLLVGSGPELGNWRPAEGLPVPAELTMAAGSVLEFKLVITGGDGEVRWQDGENRYLLASGDAAVTLPW